MEFKIFDCGLIDYIEAWKMQKNEFTEIIAGKSSGKIFVLQHPHVYTLGRSAVREQIKGEIDDDIPVPQDISREPNARDSFSIGGVKSYLINRGGGITYHGPGQIIIYPVIQIEGARRNLDHLIGFFESLIIDTCMNFGVEAYARKDQRGVWTARGKIASIGIAVKKSVLLHGVSFNICCDLSHFSQINPCGIANCDVVNLNDLSEKTLAIDDVKFYILSRFNDFWKNYWEKF